MHHSTCRACVPGEVREEVLGQLPLHLRRSALEKIIQLIKLHAPEPDDHMLAAEAANVLTNLCGHDRELDKITLKSKVGNSRMPCQNVDAAMARTMTPRLAVSRACEMSRS